MIQTNTPRSVYQGNGTTNVFNFGFPITAASQVLATLTDTVAATEITLVLNQDYTVNYAALGSQSPSDWYITYPISGSPMDNTHQLTLTPNFPILNLVDLQNQSGFFPETIESMVDYLTLVCQQLQEQLNRCFQYAIGDNTAPTDIDTLAAQLSSLSNNQSAALTAAVTATQQAAIATVQATAAAASAASTGSQSVILAQAQAAIATAQAAIATAAATAAANSAAQAGSYPSQATKVLSTTGDGATTTFALTGNSGTGNVNSLQTWIDGVLQEPGVDYTLNAAGTSITFTTAPLAGTHVVAVQAGNVVGVPNGTSFGIPAINSFGQVFTGDGTTTAFTLSQNNGTNNSWSYTVDIDGVPQVPTVDFTVATNTLTFTSAPLSGVKIAVRGL